MKRVFSKGTAYKSLNGGASFVNNANSELFVQDDFESAFVTVAKKTGSNNKTNFNVVLQLEGGLFDVPGSALAGINPTKVDAFVTYEIKVYRGGTENDNKLIAGDSATVQALLVKGQNYTWIHKMTIPTAQSEANVGVKVKIVDTSSITYDQSTGTNQKLILKAIGYNLI